jgi:flagellar motor switch protein FliM
MAAVTAMPTKETRGSESIVPVSSTVLKMAGDSISPVGMSQIERHPEWKLLSRIPLRLQVAVPVPHFKVKDLLGLKPGTVVHSVWPSSDDVPLKVGAVQVSWSEFEVVEKRMAIRVTRLA